MKHTNNNRLVTNGLIMCLTIVILSSCDRDSSPEGRMSIKIENLQKELIDSLRQQNKAILDSLSKMRSDIQKLQHR